MLRRLVSTSTHWLPASTVALRLLDSKRYRAYEVQSGATGDFEFVGLPPGAYRLEASLPGFAMLLLNLEIAADTERTLQLELGTVHETINVSGDAVVTPPDPSAAEQREEAVRRFREAETKGGRPVSNWDGFRLIKGEDDLAQDIRRNRRVTDEEFARWSAAYVADEPNREVRRAIRSLDLEEPIDRERNVEVLAAFIAANGLGVFLDRFGLSDESYEYLVADEEERELIEDAAGEEDEEAVLAAIRSDED